MAKITIGVNPRKTNAVWNWLLLFAALALLAWNLIVLTTQQPNGINDNPANTALSAAIVAGALSNLTEQRLWKIAGLVTSGLLITLTFWLSAR